MINYKLYLSISQIKFYISYFAKYLLYPTWLGLYFYMIWWIFGLKTKWLLSVMYIPKYINEIIDRTYIELEYDYWNIPGVV
jgi:hypothetical protein